MKKAKIYQLIILILFIFFNVISSQDIAHIYVQIPDEQLSVEQYLQLVENNTQYKLTYSSDIIDESKLVNFNFDSLSVKSLLDTLFYNKSIKYVIKGNLLILSPQNTKALQKKAYKVSGIIKNTRSSKPIPFASVYVPMQSIGTISNMEGKFELYLPETCNTDTIMVSCIGYLGATILSKDFLIKPVEVLLSPDRYEIAELVVRQENPNELVINAIENKVHNYSEKPNLLTAFFRESSKQNDTYISLSEAIIDIYKASYNNDNEDLVKLKKGRRGSNTESSELVNLVVEGGLYNSMQLDIIKYGVSFLDPDQMAFYDYIMDKQITYGGRQTYVIRFKFKSNKDFAGFDGTIYMDASSLAIVRCEFEISDAGLKYAREMMIKKSPLGFQVKPKYGKYEVEYRLYNNTWNLMQGRSEIGVKVKKQRGSKNKGYSCLFTSTSEFVVTGQETEGFERIKYREASKPNDILYDQISSTDMEFWDNETIILPEEPLMKTIEKLKLNERNDKEKLTSTKSANK